MMLAPGPVPDFDLRQPASSAGPDNADMVPTGTRHLLADGRSVIIRPVTADDESGARRFFARLSPRTRRMRFHQFAGVVTDALAHFYTHIDHDRHAAFVCEHSGELVGEARYFANPGGSSCELGIVVADDWHHTGIAGLLMRALIDAARTHGFRSIEGLVHSDNSDMLQFVKTFGFEVEPMPERPVTVRVMKRL
jgi:GNAT superfamily N-acetyltransferase